MYSNDGIAAEWSLRDEEADRIVIKDLQTARNQIEHLENQLERGKEQIDQYASEMSQKHRELGELRKDNKTKLAYINNLKLQAKADQDTIKKLSKRDENMRSTKEEVQLKRIQELEQQTIRLRDERRKDEQGVQAVRNQVSEKETEVEGLKSRLKEAEFLAEENNKLKEDLQSQAKQLQQLQKDIYTKTKQLALLQDRRRMEEYLEQQIKDLIKEINDETQKVESIEEQIKQITRRLDQLKKTSKEQSKDFNKNYYNTAKFKFKLRELQGEIKLRKEKIPPLKKKLTNTRYKLLELKEGEALIYKRHPITKEIIS